jgi:hypothetical protein
MSLGNFVSYAKELNDIRAAWKRGHPAQGCQMVSFQTKNSNLGKF